MASPKALLATARRKRPFLDHLIRTYQRYQADTGDRLAASVTYFWFLSLFPIVLLAVSLLGLVYGDEAGDKVAQGLSGILPGNLVDTISETVAGAAAPAGVLGILGLLYSGLGWIDALREAIRTVWHQNVLAGNIVVRKLIDVVVLVGLFATIATSIAVTAVTSQAAGFVLELIGVQETLGARITTRVLAIGLATLADVALFLYLFSRLAKVRTPIKRILKGAVFGAVGFQLLKLLGGYYVARTTTNGEATYGTFAVVVGLLVFLNLVSRFLLIAAAFVVTAPYDSDIEPSGTASPEAAKRAGIPEEFADDDPDDPPNVQEEGAPAPLQAALMGKVPPQDEPEGKAGLRDAGRRQTGDDDGGRARSDSPYPGDDARSRSRSAGAGGTPVVRTERSDGGSPSGEAAVRTAARATAGAGAVVLGGVAWHLAGTVRRVLRG